MGAQKIYSIREGKGREVRAPILIFKELFEDGGSAVLPPPPRQAIYMLIITILKRSQVFLLRTSYIFRFAQKCRN